MKAHNKISNSSQMHPTLQLAWQHCEEVRQELLVVLHKVTATDWLRRPTPTTWTIAEQVDHLIRSEIGTSKMSRKLIGGAYNGAKHSIGAKFFTAALDIYPYGPTMAPQELVPTVDLPFSEAFNTLATTHRRFYQELTALDGGDPELLESPDPATGVWFTLGGWIQLQALHEAHHLQQIIKLLEN
ncbi:MAG: DinB family protein [Acidobacteriota bacterium]